MPAKPDSLSKEFTGTTFRWKRISDTTGILILHLEAILREGSTGDHVEAATVVAALASLSNLHSYVMNQAGIPAALVNLVSSLDVAVVQAASKAMLELSRNDQVRTVLRAAGAIEVLNHFLYAAVQNYAPIFAPAVYAALQCLKALSQDHTGKASVNSAGGIPLYTTILQSSFHSSTTSAAAALLAHLATTATGAISIAATNGLQGLLLSLPGLEPQHQLQCMRAVSTMAASPDLHDTILQCGGIPTLVTILRYGPQSQVAHLAAKALAHVTSDPASKLAAIAAGAAAQLVAFLEATLTDAGAHWAALCFCNMSTEEPGRVAISNCGAVPLLLQAAFSFRTPATAASLNGLANLTKCGRICNELVGVGIVPHLLDELSRTDAVHEEELDSVLMCMANVANSTDVARQQIATSNGIHKVVQVAMDTASARTLFFALDVLAVCSQHVQCAEQIIDFHAVDMIMRLITSVDGISNEIAARCLRTLAMLAKHPQLRPDMSEASLLAALLNKAQPGQPELLRSWATQVLTELAAGVDQAMYVADMGVGQYFGDQLRAEGGGEEMQDLAVQLLDSVTSHGRAADVVGRDVGLVDDLAVALHSAVQGFRIEQVVKVCRVLTALCVRSQFAVEVCASSTLMGVLDDVLDRPKAACSPLTRHMLGVLQALVKLPASAQLLVLQYREIVKNVLGLLRGEMSPGVDQSAGCVLKGLLMVDADAWALLKELRAVDKCLQYMMSDRQPAAGVCELLELLSAGSSNSPRG